ncbi:MAG TPA: HdeD family acid-resistance protein [Burkholderiales bacterium]|nr:HdeD family acid-resistance protein [Burkholderiales bacterium]
MPITAMLEDLARNWGWIELRGIVAVLFGVLALLWPGVTLAALVILWGAFALADGILSLIAAFKIRDKGKPFWSLLIVGLLGVAAGIVTFLWPGITAFILLMFIAAWAFVMGIFQIIAAIRLRKEIENEWLLGLSGVLSVIFGVLMFLQPSAGALAVIWIIGAYAIFFGVLLIVLGFRLKRHAGTGTGSPAPA